MTRRPFIALALCLAIPVADAAGPLRLSEETGTLKPLVWDTSQGPIPVYVDGGGAFTYDYDDVTPLITIERANELTAFAFNEWSKVPTSTFKAEIAGTIADKLGIADVTGENATQLYNVENGRGFWVLYDTDGSILEDYFGIPRDAVLGIAFPEFSDGKGHIIEATAVINGWNVHINDTEGKQVAGVFTHEFGHAINLSHTQVNGPMVYQSSLEAPQYPGVKGCVAPIHSYNHPADMPGANPADPAMIETMFPFINHAGSAAIDQSTIDSADDIAGISNLYPTADYASTRGTISGVLRLKDGKTEYAGINVIARNLDNPLFDAVSDMTGSTTQGHLGPDGRFTIRNLTPGAKYVVYIERITSGGYPTTPQVLASQSEYWNVAEGSNPMADAKCDSTPIVVQAGVTQHANITFNGYLDGVQFTPLVDAYVLKVARNGKRASGVLDKTPFFWDAQTGIELLPPGYVASHAALDRQGKRMLVGGDPDGNGIHEPMIFGDGQAIALGDLNGNTCGSDSNVGVSSAIGWSMDATASKAVGYAYLDRNGNGVCGNPYVYETVPFVWDARTGMRELPTAFASAPSWVRASGISGNGRVIVGTAGLQQGVAWVDEGPMINLGELMQVRDVGVASHDGTRVPMYSNKTRSMLLWNAMRGTGPEAFTDIDGMRYCRDLPYYDFGVDACARDGEEALYQRFGVAPMGITAITETGNVLLGRAGGAFTGYGGGIWVEGLGWMRLNEFLRRQGVVEAESVPFDSPSGISGSGDEIVGSIPNYPFTWMIKIEQVYICRNGRSSLVPFPAGLTAKLATGARFGRCEFL